MKRTVSLLLVLLLLLSTMPVRSEAATMESKAGIVTVANSSLNVRSAPSTSSAVLSSLPKGSYVTLLGRSGDWWQVEYGKGLYGYCHAGYITVASGSPARVSTQSLSLNIRSGPGTSYAKLGSLSKGEVVIILSASGGWSRILYHGRKTGYVSAQYLSAATEGARYPALSLNVPSFKQTDSRWASVLIGASGKTIAQIGCATTAIAMMESYRTGTTIYPDAMSRRLSYTSSGSVYWPSHYTVVTDGGGYLYALYALLKQGKPVLFGAKTSSGNQHWVVVTGFTGGSTLTASGFSIHDPGSSSRTNLQQFLNAYPIFYKYFYA